MKIQDLKIDYKEEISKKTVKKLEQQKIFLCSIISILFGIYNVVIANKIDSTMWYLIFVISSFLIWITLISKIEDIFFNKQYSKKNRLFSKCFLMDDFSIEKLDDDYLIKYRDINGNYINSLEEFLKELDGEYSLEDNSKTDKICLYVDLISVVPKIIIKDKKSMEVIK